MWSKKKLLVFGNEINNAFLVKILYLVTLYYKHFTQVKVNVQYHNFQNHTKPASRQKSLVVLQVISVITRSLNILMEQFIV